MNWALVFRLLVEGLQNPAQSLARLFGLPLDLRGAWLAFFAATMGANLVLAVVKFAYALIGAIPFDGSLLVITALSMVVQVIFTFVLLGVGRLLGGTGQLREMLLMVAWMQLVMILPSLVIMTGLVFVPSSELGWIFLLVIATIYVTVSGLKAAHEFATLGRAIGAFFLSIVAISLLSSLLTSVTGIPELVGYI